MTAVPRSGPARGRRRSRVGEVRVPVEVVVDRVVDAAAVLAAVAHRRASAMPGVIDEGRVVRPRPERADAQVGPLARPGRVSADAARDAAAPARASRPVSPVSGIRMIPSPRSLTKCSSVWRAARVQVPAAVAVGVDVGHGVLLQLGLVLLRPTRSSRAASAPRRPTRSRRSSASASSPASAARRGARLLELGRRWPLTGSVGAVHPARRGGCRAPPTRRATSSRECWR